MNGFIRGNGELHLPRLLSETGRASTSIFPGINSYGNHHGENTTAAFGRQLLCTTSIGNSIKLKELFDCIPTLKDLIELFEFDYFGSKNYREFSYTLRIIDILRQSSSGNLGGQESLFRLHQYNVPNTE